VRPGIYETVTQRIVGELEAGRVPWVQPWDASGGAQVALPRNAASGRPYSGINILILWRAVIAQQYPSQDWVTFRQAQALGGSVRKGERGQMVVYADRFTPEEERVRASEQESEARSIAFLKRFTVFNVAQCDGLGGIGADPDPLAPDEIVPVGEALIRASGIEYRIGGNEPFYSPIFDFVQVPPPRAFFAALDYYRTAFHELTHATGHATRLGRDLSHRFGSPAYAREELVAELGSAFLCACLGIAPTLRHADYLAEWLAVLKADNHAIFRAASQASKAADWLLARLAEADEAAV
jgi:antirestriction protein ArdC